MTSTRCSYPPCNAEGQRTLKDPITKKNLWACHGHTTWLTEEVAEVAARERARQRRGTKLRRERDELFPDKDALSKG